MHRSCSIILLAIFAIFAFHPNFAKANEADLVKLYLDKIKPTLQSRCYACHGALKQESSLRLDTVASMREGGDSGNVILPAESLLLERVTADESYRMPPEGAALTAEEIQAIQQWLAAGAPGPAQEEPEAAPDDHWAFQPPQAADFPADLPVGAHPIDVLLSQRRGQRPVAGPAAWRQQLRRVYLDLTGLPPTLAQQEAFLQDATDERYLALVNDLLAQPQHGERWARHWMDIWRYSDWYGLGAQLRYSQKHLWHWRDWIIESLNDDLGYDEMVRLMLAADETHPDDLEAIRATGFLARQYYLFNRTTWLDSTLEHTSKALLGLTVNCAKCHDHKYDPLKQSEYYQLRAIFEPYQVRLDPVAGETDLEQDGIPRVFDAHPDAATFLHIRGDEKQPDKDHPLSPGLPGIFNADYTPQSVALPMTAHRPELRDYVEQDRKRQAAEKLRAAQEAAKSLEQQLARVGAQEGGEDPRKGKLLLDEPFEQLQAHWQAHGDWRPKSADGDTVLRQTAVGAERRSLTWDGKAPADFVASLKFRITGGEQWKSVGIAFDVAGDREKMIYLSAYAGGPKLQVSYKAPQQAYPDDGRVAREIRVGSPYTLTIAAQGPLLNIWVDDTLTLAYTLPVKREPGALALIAFDAAVEFDHFSLRELPANSMLSSDGKSASPDALERQLAAAKQKVHVATAEQRALDAAYRAARAEASDDEQQGDLKLAAGAAERQWKLAQAELALLTAQQALETAKEEQRSEKQKAVAAAKEARNQAQEAASQPSDVYTLAPAGLKALEGPAEKDAARRAPFPAVSTGRRTALAAWITDRQNPLTARVAVNHIWARHFGDPLVESVTDFGRRAKQPVQQRLLDHLAVDFMEHGWSMKRLHRLIVTSAAYRRSSHASEAVQAADPANRYLTRRRPLRLESDTIRDSLLSLAGSLDPTMYGPTVPPSDKVTHRRSIYFTHSRDAQHKFLNMFDHADILRCYRRQESIVPQQALAMANSALSLEASKQVALNLHQERPQDADFIHAAFRHILCWDPEPAEVQASQAMLDKTTALLRQRRRPDPVVQARQNFIHALINHNDFVTLR